MYRASCRALIGLGVLHLLVLGLDAASYAPGWLSGALWTFEHWLPVADQSDALARSGFAFWSTFGSFALPTIAIGYLLLWLDDCAIEPPRAVLVGLTAWAVVGTALMPPSGLPLAILIAIGLLRGRRRA